jgi:hypothetical protein
LVVALKFIAAEDVTVSGTAIGITSTLITANVVQATVQNRSGGSIYFLVGTPVDTAGNGEILVEVDDFVLLYGLDDIRGAKFIKVSGESDATIAAQLFGLGA